MPNKSIFKSDKFNYYYQIVRLKYENKIICLIVYAAVQSILVYKNPTAANDVLKNLNLLKNFISPQLTFF